MNDRVQQVYDYQKCEVFLLVAGLAILFGFYLDEWPLYTLTLVLAGAVAVVLLSSMFAEEIWLLFWPVVAACGFSGLLVVIHEIRIALS